jgi:3-oxoacyl-[acyl-carrier-protein] synthase-3
MSQHVRTRISGTGKAVPSQIRTNDDLAKTIATSDEWISARTGIRARRILEEGRSTSDLATEAAKAALDKAELGAHEVDCIIVATVTPDMPMPAVAVTVQQKLGAPACAAFDMSAACAGFLYGLSVGDSFIRAGQFRRVLVIGVEILSRIVDWTDRNTCVLFGDGAGAVLLTPTAADDPRHIMSTHLFADGAGAQFLNIPAGGSLEPATAATIEKKRHFVYMQGKPIFTHAVKNISRACQIALEHNRMTPADVDWIVAHQANLRILEGVAERCGIPLEKFFLNIHKYGNTSSASIPIALDEAITEGKVRPGQLVLMGALGAGLSWGSALVRV